MLGVIGGPPRCRDLDDARVVEGAQRRVEVGIGPHRDQLWVTDGVGPVGVRYVDRVADRRQLALCIWLALLSVTPGHVVDLLLQRAGLVLPALDDLDAVEIGDDLIGRDAELDEILDLSASHRLVTLTGVGGIGKTRLALAVARRLLPQFADGGWLAEFSPLGGPGLVAATVAGAIGLELSGGEVSTQRVARALAGPRMLTLPCARAQTVAAPLAKTEAL